MVLVMRCADSWSAHPWLSPRSVSVIPLQLPYTRVAQPVQVVSADKVSLGCGGTSANKGTSFWSVAGMPASQSGVG